MKLRALLPFALVVSAVAPGAAAAATVTITSDAGTPVPLTEGLTQRHMNPEIAFTFADDEKRYSAAVNGPAGTPASFGSDCSGTGFSSPERVKYQGNGTYTLILRISKASEDSACAQATETRINFVINASTAITPPASQPLLMRDPGSFSSISFAVPVDLNPGADSYEFRYAPNATLGPDGGITGDSETAFVDTSKGTASVSFSKPGRYTFVLRAKSFSTDATTAWSPRVDVTVVAPFDFIGDPGFPDSRGPSYSVAGQLRETSATGKITIALAKGSSKKFRRLGTAKIRKGGKFSLKFKLKTFGKFKLRYTYKGSATTAAGTVTQPIVIRKTIF